ncbi:hypothetical protein QLQ12_16935 [Actinoplanes sp. NEAU-A12]|uniref:Uncharacterized protein n=1 Tax=Actinoplanes sandaracinus TaxID=3045177 RepID=A0ABT6WKP9_9ACTN|nr:hypothetical protein [Actinoplanes sandaracinus]MDI6100293.1 hypothetical protein [Actinoplanes sandaracinus]
MAPRSRERGRFVDGDYGDEVKKIDFGVIGRTIAVGSATGAITGFVVMIVLLFRMVIAEEHMNPNPNMGGFVLAAIVGALVGLITGFVAGLLLLPASLVRDRPVLGALACAVACGGTLSSPFLVVGFGWDNWPETPWGWAVAGLVAFTAAVGAWKSRYILRGRPAASSDQSRTAPADS